MIKVELFIDQLYKQRWPLHVFFWTVIVFLYVLFFGRQSNNYPQTLLLVSLLMPITMGASYFLNYRLVPNYLLKAHYKKFIAYFIYTILASLYAEMLIVIFIFISLADVQVGNMTPASIDIFFLLLALLMAVLLAGAIKLFKHWIESKERNQKLIKEKAEAELKFLKTQLNPHFLFNTLNNLYFLATQKSERTPTAILALSEILDYVLHSGKRRFVSLEEELQQVENYLALEFMRYEDRVEIKSAITGIDTTVLLPPLVVISLIENAFKHGVLPNAGKCRIEWKVQVESKQLVIYVSNSCKSGGGQRGIGLDNLRNQLDLLYGDAYSLMIRDQEAGMFTVTLTLPIQL
jgi:two-component system LytT family sensor kinase